MKLLRFLDSNVNGPTILDQAEQVSGYESISWTERYRDPGEFSITAKLSSGLQEILMPGSYITHNETYEVMVVENHQHTESLKEDPLVTISGRSFETILEQRIVGANKDWTPPPTDLTEYLLAADETWAQAVTLINDHILLANVWDVEDEFPGVIAQHNLGATVGNQQEYVIKRGSVHQRVLDLLAIDDLGIRTIRKNSFGYISGDDDNTILLIHPGYDLRDTVLFSWVHGDIDLADYLKSIKKKKTRALVVGTYVEAIADETFAPNGTVRTMLVDGSDIDGYLTTNPVGATRTDIIDKLIARGLAVLRAQTDVDITRIDISNNQRYRYRYDYNIGDIVTVQGNYGVTQDMRVIEYVEIEDSTGITGHPTLSVI